MNSKTTTIIQEEINMKKETKAFMTIILFTCFLLVVSSWLNSKTISSTNENDYLLTPFFDKNVYGLKIKTVDGSRHFFAGIQRKTIQFTKNADNFSNPQSVLISKKIINGNLSEYIVNLGVVEVLLKIFSYHQTSPEKNFHNPSTHELQYLNYIVENSSCKKCSKDDAILLNRNNIPKSHALNNNTRNKLSILAMVIQIIPK